MDPETGQLAEDEFDLRVGWALAALTYADLDALTAGISVASPRNRSQSPCTRTAGTRSGRRRITAKLARSPSSHGQPGPGGYFP